MKSQNASTPHATRNPLWAKSHDLSEATRREVIDLLNFHLVDAIDLGMRAKHAHWNVKGSKFIVLHAFFDEVASTINKLTDEVAERIVSLGGTAGGTLQIVHQLSRLPVHSPELWSGSELLHAFVSALSDFAKSSREAIDQVNTLGDAVSADIFTQIAKTADDLLWRMNAQVFEE